MVKIRRNGVADLEASSARHRCLGTSGAPGPRRDAMRGRVSGAGGCLGRPGLGVARGGLTAGICFVSVGATGLRQSRKLLQIKRR